MPIWEHFDSWLEHIARVMDFIGIFALLVGACRTIIQGIFQELRLPTGLSNLYAMQRVRLELGGYILLSLELLIVADIIRSVISRTMDDLTILVILVIIRTAISFFLGRELEAATEQPQAEKSEPVP